MLLLNWTDALCLSHPLEHLFTPHCPHALSRDALPAALATRIFKSKASWTRMPLSAFTRRPCPLNAGGSENSVTSFKGGLMSKCQRLG